MGYQACLSLGPETPRQCRARPGEVWHHPGHQGDWAMVCHTRGLTVAALVVVNTWRCLRQPGSIIAGARTAADSRTFADTWASLNKAASFPVYRSQQRTTLIILTNARLTLLIRPSWPDGTQCPGPKHCPVHISLTGIPFTLSVGDRSDINQVNLGQKMIGRPSGPSRRRRFWPVTGLE
jgi:hypothetical protein